MENQGVKELRVRLGLSQERFARLLDVSLQTVRRWESGVSRPLPIISVKLEELRREAGGAGERMGGTHMSKTISAKKGEAKAEVGMGGLFKGIGSLLDLVSKMAEEGKEEYSSSGEVEALGGKLKGVYGFSVRMGLGGKPVIEQFGNVKETESGAVVSETREPLVDVMDEGDRLVVIAELPGVEEKDIHLRVEGDILEVAASARDRRYRREVLLPSAVDPASLKSSYRNGILEIRLTKRQPSAG
ncbi:MAG: archaeal heat shock protein Hsp20 [Chloroflexota bacterium]